MAKEALSTHSCPVFIPHIIPRFTYVMCVFQLKLKKKEKKKIYIHEKTNHFSNTSTSILKKGWNLKDFIYTL